ncbi:MAG: tetratricopeptide repeat protein [Roseococcus sp.]|nr:tetratricopeptide repeat protein [Roseococcus sp.]
MRSDPAAQALALHQAGRLKEAGELYDRALAQRPRDAALLGLAGALQLQMGKPVLAAKLLRRALAEGPAQAEVQHNLGAALLRLERPAEAAEAFAAATRLDPGQLGGWFGEGQARRALGQIEPAMACFRRALTLAPDHAPALAVLGTLLDEAGAPAEAEPLLRRAVLLQPGQATWLNSLGLVLHRRYRLEEAEACFNQALALAPELETALGNLGELLLQQRRGAEAATRLAAGLAARDAARRPAGPSLLDALFGARLMLCDWRDHAALSRRVRAAQQATPHLLYHEDSPARLRRLAEHMAAGQRRTPLAQPLVHRRRAGPIRIGYLSHDLHTHATAHLIAEVLELHERARFHITAYSTGPDEASAMRARLRAAVEDFQDVAALSDRALVERIAGDGIELLVDLKGWTEHSRLPALAWRPAPVQATWLGYPGTLGAEWVDYAIVDGVVAPPGAEALFTEHLVRLPDCYQPNDRQRRIAAPPDRAAAGLPPQGLVLACFCQTLKLTPEVFGLWMRVLAATPGAVLWLLEAAPEAMDNLRREAAARGVAPGRLVFAPRLPPDQHLARYALVDLALDTFPYGSHTTASDALWAGCPQMAITGESFAARVSTSLVTAMGLPDLAAPGLDAHEAMLLRLCADAPVRAALRGRIAAARETAPLFDTPRFVTHLEAAYQAMVERRRAGLPPAAISLPTRD